MDNKELAEVLDGMRVAVSQMDSELSYMPCELQQFASLILFTYSALRLERNSGPISSLVAHYVAHGRLPDTSDPGATAAILPK